MEKQVHSNTDKFNKISTFLVKFIYGENFDMLKKSGFEDGYTSDPDISSMLTLGANQRMLFLLFRNKKLKLEDLKKISVSLANIPIDVVFSYELVNDYSMVVIDFPEKYIADYDHIVNGRYSKLSESFKNHFPITKDVYNAKKIRIGKEYTIYHHIFNKTNWLKNFWCERLNLVELDDKLELWHSPDKADLVFEVKNLFKE